MFCKHCGKQIDEDALFCPHCGYNVTNPLNEKTNSPSAKTKIRNKSKTKRTAIFIAIFLAIILIGVSIFIFINHRNDFGTDITEEDFEFDYKINNDSVIVIITPKFDIKDFSFTLSYNGHGLMNSHEIEHLINFAPADKNLQYTENLAEIDSYISGELYYVSMDSFQGKKQNKNKNVISNANEKENTECNFLFTLNRHNTGSTFFEYEYILDCTITNNTATPILELQNLTISIDFGHEISCNYSSPRLIFDNAILPGKSITLKSLSGNKHLGLGTHSDDELNALFESPIESISYSNQSYKVVYSTQ